MSNPFDLVRFDCDGVLVDSERVANEVFADILREECGLDYTLEQMFDTFVGHSRLQCLEIVEGLIGQAPSPRLAQRYQDDINAALLKTVEAVPGIKEVLADLDIPCCVASGGSHEKMKLTLGKTSLAQYFNGNIFSTSDVARSKPHPDIYLHAAKSMGVVDTARCLVVEDSPLGVSGGVAAGMTVFGFAEMMPATKLLARGAYLTFDSMADLPDLIASHRESMRITSAG